MICNMEEAIETLTKMYITEYSKKEKETLTMKKEDLIKFCIKLLKVIQKNKNMFTFFL